MKERFFCRTCREWLPLEENRKGQPLTKKNTGQCKGCHRDYCKNRLIRIAAESSPQSYWSCDGCDRSFSKFVPGSNGSSNKRRLKEFCPFCGCKALSTFDGAEVDHSIKHEIVEVVKNRNKKINATKARAILRYDSWDYSAKDIAHELNISVQTVYNYLKKLR